MLRRPPQSRRMAINPATSAQRKTAVIDAEPIEAVARVGANVSSEEDERCELMTSRRFGAMMAWHEVAPHNRPRPKCKADLAS